ncbi:hypothetical protein ACU6T4_07500 [Avibacterium paragallinarum]|uniref:Uncharacterized protein n=1 Tax=Avibacterium paragallinarum TaxID=728 RepID=A0A0F5EV57_AVIPA|nr:hypothetical protein [Avibacterium paragallinarum]AZI13591.1 hypothetical protein EIA51_02405 [Avibacterium paragallinarum]QIR12094.1 hypothetical protein HBL79_07530 [Avibacterium paragallinarum]QJE09086.1 hypothetical protein HHJ62_01520 [Avibacterium paragallinarum]QJE11282.1 hypothetical protein HHJ61_01520 [Avibacterium paragallinarum]QJE13479.1 hypothetical protein HHJ60_01525 [Avibacterium paragallinarum]
MIDLNNKNLDALMESLIQQDRVGKAYRKAEATRHIQEALKWVEINDLITIAEALYAEDFANAEIAYHNHRGNTQ